MVSHYTFIQNMLQEAEPPAKGILSHTLHNDDKLKVVVFGFAEGEELSEHTASMPAILQNLSGHAKLLLGEDVNEFEPGSFVYLPAQLPHSVTAVTPLVMLLFLLK